MHHTTLEVKELSKALGFGQIGVKKRVQDPGLVTVDRCEGKQTDPKTHAQNSARCYIQGCRRVFAYT